MNRSVAIVVLMCLATPTTVHAQNALSVVSRTTTQTIQPVTQYLTLTRTGTAISAEGTLLNGYSVVDRQDVDYDNDGDVDALLTVDATGSQVNGRGAVLAVRRGHEWVGHTIAATLSAPGNSGANWGRVEFLRPGVALLHLWHSEFSPGMISQTDEVRIADHGALRVVHRATVQATAGNPSVLLQASDVDHDGTSELVERITAVTVQQEQSRDVLRSQTTQRVLRWTNDQQAFVPAPDLSWTQQSAQRTLDQSYASWRNGDLAQRDLLIQRAYELDPFSPRVRLAYAHSLLRELQPAQALDVLDFPWSRSIQTDVLALQVEASVRASQSRCVYYMTALRQLDPNRAERLLELFRGSYSHCVQAWK